MIDRSVGRLVKVGLLSAGLLGAGPTWAITDEEIYRDLRFNFINPGGRSLGLAGAFTSIADDATAAQANPAGLTNLEAQPQFFAEIRYLKTEDAVTTIDFLDPLAPFLLDVTTEPQAQTIPSFVSYVYPFKKVSLGASRHELLNLQNDTLNSYQVCFSNCDLPPDQWISDVQSGEGRIRMKLVNYNVSVGWQIHDRFRIGATLTYGMLDLESSLVNTYLDPTGQVLGVPELAGVPLEMFRTEADDSDSALSGTVGLQWRPLDNFGVGAVYKAGGDFEIEETVTGVPADPSLRPGQITERLFFNETGNLLAPDFTTFSFVNQIHIPDVAVLGVFYQPLPALTLSLDAEHIWYSNLVDDFNSRLNVLTVGWATEEEAAFTVDDATNIHFGVQYQLLRDPAKTGWAFRAGYRQDKDSRIRSDFAPGGFGLASNDNFPPGEDLDHFTAGVGIVFGKRFQLDVAADYSSDALEAVTSFIVRF